MPTAKRSLNPALTAVEDSAETSPIGREALETAPRRTRDELQRNAIGEILTPRRRAPGSQRPLRPEPG